MNSVEFFTVSGNLLCQLANHLLQFLVVYEQIFKHNYRFFYNNEFTNENNQIDWKTSFDSHDMNLCFDRFLHILKKEKSLIDKPWIDNHLQHFMRVRDACFIKYCRAKKATEKLKFMWNIKF